MAMHSYTLRPPEFAVRSDLALTLGDSAAREHSFTVLILYLSARRDERILRILGLPELPHLGAGCQQLVERAGGLDPAILQHDDLVGPAQRGAPMRDGENCRVLGAGGWGLELRHR